ncbi:MAG: DUF2191 domain-containing protein [Nitrospirales bacterium]
MRTTLTLDDDVATKLKAISQRSGQSFRETVNNTLRRGLISLQVAPPPKPFRVVARNLGQLRPGITLDSISDVLEQVEGPLYR